MQCEVSTTEAEQVPGSPESPSTSIPLGFQPRVAGDGLCVQRAERPLAFWGHQV